MVIAAAPGRLTEIERQCKPLTHDQQELYPTPASVSAIMKEAEVVLP